MVEGNALMGFDEALAARGLRIGVVGLGYVGLPLAIGYAEAGFVTTGFDVVEARTASLNAGHSHVDDITHERVATVVAAGRFSATADSSALGACDVVFVCVPTPFDTFKTPDLAFVRSATATVASVARPGMLVILQSTTYPGTTTDIVVPALREAGLRPGEDVYVAFSPERVDPGNTRYTVHNTPKVVGGIDAESTRRAKAVLEAVMDEPGLVVTVSSPDAAEMTKLLENIYRAVNIALVNELAVLSDKMGIDIWEVIDAAKTKPFGFQAFYPGIGPGGHCIPVDPYYLSWKARQYDFQTKFIELAADTNLAMAEYAVARMGRVLNGQGKALRGSKVLCLGAAFKARVSDIRNSRAIRVMELLIEQGAEVSYSDPLVPSLRLGEHEHGVGSVGPELTNVDLDGDLSSYDLIAILVAGDWPLDSVAAAGGAVFDAVNALGGSSLYAGSETL
jgi:UDP-N-acetyl-D-glucosamine dehydrogenase